MGGIFGGGAKPKLPPPGPTPEQLRAEAAEEAARQQREGRKRRGRASTLLAGAEDSLLKQTLG